MNINLKNLKRNYKENPLKRGEYPEIEDINYLFIDCGLSKEETAEICNCNPEKIKIICRKYKIQKSKEQKAELRKRTTLLKYGVENISQLKEIKDKKKQTCLVNYGVDNPAKSDIVYEKIRETCLERYGVDSSNRTEEKKQAIRNTMLKKYGKNNIVKTDFVKQKLKEQQEQINIKIVQTKKKNNSFNKSENEDKIFKLLSANFKVKRQYQTNLYSFACDFYLPEIDLYIEYQDSWTHGGMVFDINNPTCLEKYRIWVDKAKTSEFYQNALNVWTVRDVIKRQIAEDNNLNWIEFFSLEEFMKWYKQICEILN